MTVALARRGSGAGRQAMQLAGAAGILSLVLGGAGVLVGQMWAFPGTGATAGEIASFADAHRSALLVDMVLTTAAVWLWLIFGVGVWLRLREADGGEGFLPACFLAGLLSFVTLLFAGFAVFFVLVYRAPEASDPRLLYDLSFGLLAISGAPTALALGSYAISTLHTGCLPRWTAWLAVVAARGRGDHRDPRHAVRLDRRDEFSIDCWLVEMPTGRPLSGSRRRDTTQL